MYKPDEIRVSEVLGGSRTFRKQDLDLASVGALVEKLD
jgi:hypothetical protein